MPAVLIISYVVFIPFPSYAHCGIWMQSILNASQCKIKRCLVCLLPLKNGISLMRC